MQISEASPAWQNYVDYMDAIVLEGLKQTTILSLRSMLNRIVKANMAEVQYNYEHYLYIKDYLFNWYDN